MQRQQWWCYAVQSAPPGLEGDIVTPLLGSLHWLRVPERIAFRLAVLCTAASMARHPLTYRPMCSASPTSAHGSDFALQRPRHLLAVACNVPQSVTAPLLLPHRLFGTACRRMYGHPHRWSCSDAATSAQVWAFSAFSGPKTLHVTFT